MLSSSEHSSGCVRSRWVARRQRRASGPLEDRPVRRGDRAAAGVRLLLLTSKYFLMGELEAACARLGYAACFVQLPSQEVGSQEFVERILAEVLRFRPDFVLTINHLDMNKKGVLTDLLARLELPPSKIGRASCRERV